MTRRDFLTSTAAALAAVAPSSCTNFATSFTVFDRDEREGADGRETRLFECRSSSVR